MKIEIGNDNEIKDSNIGNNNTIDKGTEESFWKKYIVPIIIGVLTTVIAGFILFVLKWN